MTTALPQPFPPTTQPLPRTTPPTTEPTTRPPTAPSPAPSRAPSTARDPWFDNAKMLLVTLVVVGHTWALLPDTRLDAGLYDFLYLWHVPAFVMVTGYLSRSFSWSRRHLSRLVSTVALPYLLFEGAMAVFRTQVGGERLELLFLDPHWPMWYLTALFLWRLATPLLRRLPHPLPVAVLVSLAGGWTTGDVLDTARAMGLLPFFVVGLLAGPQHLELLRRPAARLAAAGAMLLALAGTVALHGSIATEWLYWRSSYTELDTSFLPGAATRVGLLLLGGALAAGFFALVPRRAGWFSRLGAATLVVYLFHGFAVKAVDYAGFPGWAQAHPLLALALGTALSVVLALALAWPPLARRLQRVVDPLAALRR